EVDLRLGGPLGEVRYVEVRDSAKVGSDCALRDVTGEIGEVRVPLEAFGVEGRPYSACCSAPGRATSRRVDRRTAGGPRSCARTRSRVGRARVATRSYTIV